MKKNMLRLTVIASLMAPSYGANAFAVADASKYGEKVMENITRIMENEQFGAIFKAGMDHLSEMIGLGVDATNNAFGNLIKREGKKEEELQNKEILEESVPAASGCHVLTRSIIAEDTDCSAENFSKEILQKSRSYISSKSAYKKSNNNSGTVDELLDNLGDKINEKIKEDPEVRMINFMILFGDNPDYLTLSPEDEEAMRDMITLMAPPFNPSDVRLSNMMASKEESVTALEEQIDMDVVRSSLVNLLSKRISYNGGFSVLHNLQAAADDQFDPKEDFSGYYTGSGEDPFEGFDTIDITTGQRKGDGEDDGEDDEFGLPVKQPFRISSHFDPFRLHPVLKRTTPHNGTDFAVGIGTPVFAPADGVVYEAAHRAGNGNFIRIRHANNMKTYYLHLSKFIVKSGPVKRGQLIALSGNTGRSTGPHLHYELHNSQGPIDSQKGVSNQSLSHEIQNSEVAMPTSILRDRMLTKSFLINLALEELKADINREFILSTKLANTIRKHNEK